MVESTTGNVKPQEKDWRTSEKQLAIIFRQMRNEVANDPVYKSMREEWRTLETNSVMITLTESASQYLSSVAPL